MTRIPRTVAGSLAGIELSGHALRYAEVDLGPGGAGGPAPIDPGPRLLRLGSCDFEFNVERALFHPEAVTHLATIARALADIYKGSTAARLGVAVHPWNSTSFFVPLMAGTPASDKLEQLRQEAAMLADVGLTRKLQVAAAPIRAEDRADGREYHWHHVIHVGDSARARLGHVAEHVRPGMAYRVVDSAAAAAEIVARLRSPEEQEGELEDPDSAPFALALGFFDECVEISVSRGSVWQYGHWATAEDVADALYFGARLVDLLQIDPSHVDRFYVYGEVDRAGDIGALEGLFGTEARPLNPMQLFRMVRTQGDPRSLSAYTACVGAALEA